MSTRRLFLHSLVGATVATQLPAFILPERRPAFDPYFVPMLEKIAGIQLMKSDVGLLFHLHRKIYTQELIAIYRKDMFLSGNDDFLPMSFEFDRVAADASTAPLLDLRFVDDRARLMNMMVDYLIANTMPLPAGISRVDNPFGFRRAMNHIAKITRRGIGNVLVANIEGFRRLNGSWRSHNTVKPICLPLEDREPFALLGYKGGNQFDTGVLLGLRVDGPEARIFDYPYDKTRLLEFMRTEMHIVRPVLVGNSKPKVGPANYWRRLV